jgi:CheY-like chemotaxis protein
MQTLEKKPGVLIVDDNHGDIFLMKSYLNKLRGNVSVTDFADGEQALEYIQNLSEFPAQEKEEVRPELIILDLNVLKVNGLEMLEFIKTSDRLKNIPVIIFSSSSRKEDINNAYLKQADCYKIKPTDITEYEDRIQEILELMPQ